MNQLWDTQEFMANLRKSFVENLCGNDLRFIVTRVAPYAYLGIAFL